MNNLHRYARARADLYKFSLGGASEGDVNNLLGQLASPEHNHTRWGSEQGDVGFRNVVSDSLRDNGRDQEADLLANPRQHVIIQEGRVHPGRSYILNQLGHRFPITVDSSGRYQAHDQNGRLYVGTTDSPDHVAWDFLANYPNQLNMTREEAENLMNRSSYGQMDTPWLHEEIDPDHSQPNQMSRKSYQVKRYAFMDRAKAALLGKKKDTTQPFNGIRFTSHPSGTYDLNNHLAAQAEHAAVKHAVHTAGLVPKRQVTEDPREYDQNVNKLTHAFVNHIRQHVHGNPNDQLTNYYLRTADKMKVPDDPSLPKTPGQPLEYRAPLPVGVRDLSTAVMPLVRKTAEDLNLRPKSTVLLPEEPSHLPKAGDELDLNGGGDENNYIDLLDPQFDEEHPDATENRVATELHKIQDVGKRRLGEFGSGKPAYEVVNDPGEQDFNFEMPQVEGLEGPTPEIQEIESHKPRAPRAKPNVIPAPKRQEMYQAIADTMKNSPIAGLSERVVKMLKEAYGLSARQANSMFESYKKIGMGNKQQKPTGRRTVPEDKYGLSRRGPSPRRFGAGDIQHGTETSRTASHLLGQSLGGENSPLLGLTDLLYEHEHPIAPYVHRMANGEGAINDNAARFEAQRGGLHTGLMPSHYPILGHGDVHSPEGQHNLSLEYLHLPNRRHYFLIAHEHHRPLTPEERTRYRNLQTMVDSRQHLFEVQPEEVQRYIQHLHDTGESRQADTFQYAFEHTPNPSPNYEERMRRSNLDPTPREEDGPTQLSRLAQVRYAAYRAPAGGMAVRGTFYKGGSMIPDMEGSFMNPKKKLNPAKLSALKARMKVSNSKI